MQSFLVLLFVLVSLLAPINATYEPIAAFKHLGERQSKQKGTTTRGYTQAEERQKHSLRAGEKCLSFCDIPFTMCNMIDFPIYPIGLNVSLAEATVQAQIAAVPDGFVSPACKEALTQFGCARSYFSCNTNPDGSITQVLPCRSICENVHTTCPSFVTGNPELSCNATNADGTPRFAVGACYAMHSLADPARNQCPGSAPFNITAVMQNTTLSLNEVTMIGALWSNAGGPRWTRKAGWPEGDPCLWEGIVCDTVSGVERLREINLYDNNLVGFLPQTFGSGVNFLRRLDLSMNKITGSIPVGITGITSLQHLEIAENQLIGSIPPSFSQLVNLEYLNLGNVEQPPTVLVRIGYAPTRSNSLTGTWDPAIFLPMKKLTYLNLGYNAFYGDLPAEFGSMTSLVAVNLGSNKLTAINFSFERLVNLTDFDVSRNSIISPLPDTFPPSIMYMGFMANYFYGTVPQSWSTLTNLKHMVLLYNNLHGDLSPVFGLTQMETFGVGYNNFDGHNILEKVCKFSSLTALNTIANNFTGTIPACLGDLSKLFLLDLANLKLEGTLPPELGKLSSVGLVTIDASGLSGTLPPELGNLPAVTQLYISQMNITGTIPAEFGKIASLGVLSLYGNQLSGEIPSSLCSLAELTRLDLSNNMLSGSIPDCFTGLGKLRNIDFSENNITGSIPNDIGNLHDIVSLRFHNMRLSGVIPNSISNIANLEILDVSGNLIDQSISSVMQALHNLKNLTTLNLSANKIHGPLDYFMFFDVAAGSLYSKLVDFNIGHNNVSGTLGNLLTILPSLSKVDVSYNQFSGPISAIPRTITVLIANGNPGMKSDDGDRIPNFLKATGTSVKANTNDTFSCVSFTGVTQFMIVEFDAAYFNYAHCQCDMGFYGDRNNCSVCLEHGDCSSHRGSMIISAGFYPSPSIERPEELVSCPQASFSKNPCNPGNDLEFKCLKGHTDRMCSKCIPGYRRDGRKCSECNDATKIVTILFSFVALIALYVYLLYPRDYITETGLLKNFLFYAQATSVVLESSAKWVDPVPLIKDIYTQANFSIGFFGFDCVYQGFSPDKEYLVTMLLPIGFAALTFVVYILLMVVLICLRGTRGVFDAGIWKHRCYFAFLFVINALYFPLISRIFSTFKCDTDPVTHTKYMSELPYIPCDFDNTQYRTMFILAILFFIPYVIGIPVLFYWLMKYYQQLAVKDGRRKMRGDVVCGFFILCYKDELYWWEAVIFARRIIFALLISLVSFTSPFLSLGIFILILLSILVNSWLSPFALKVTNLLDLVSFSIILLTFLSGILFSSPDFRRYATQLAITVFVLNIFIISVYAIVYITIIVNTRFPQIRDSVEHSKYFSFIPKWFDSMLEYSVHNARHMVKVLSKSDLAASASTYSLGRSTSALISSSSFSPTASPAMSPSASVAEVPSTPPPRPRSQPPLHSSITIVAPAPPEPSASSSSSPPPSNPPFSPSSAFAISPTPLVQLSSSPAAPSPPSSSRFPSHAYSTFDLHALTLDVLDTSAAKHLSLNLSEAINSAPDNTTPINSAPINSTPIDSTPNASSTENNNNSNRNSREQDNAAAHISNMLGNTNNNNNTNNSNRNSNTYGNNSTSS